MKKFSASADINAPAPRVWQVMTDVDRWHEWTASITSISRIGGAPFGMGMNALVRQPRFPPARWTVTEIVPGQSFTWTSSAPGLRVDGRHEIAPTPTGSRATVSVEFEGFFGDFFGGLTSAINGRYLALEAAGLKARSENPNFFHSRQ